MGNNNDNSGGNNAGRSLLPYIIILVAILAVIFWAKSSYNGMVEQEETVKTAWSQVENQYQRRLDLIPNLVSTVKGYAAHERETLEAVINARAKASAVSIDVSNLANLDAAALQRFQASQGELGSALSRLLAVSERYPELKANEAFTTLQVQLEGTENRIAVERRRFNQTAQQYNTGIRKFPANILASLFGFGQRPYFTAEEGADSAPTVDFQ
ncbi:MAG: LemA family protein [Deltaproteobacteria bacterium]|jgi:LemA protein|nr:LemA family protein [Deltaproteobacteria bacterium]